MQGRESGARSLVAVTVSAMSVGCSSDAAVVQTGTTPMTAPPAPLKPPTATSIRDGAYTIGVDIAVGTWHTDGPRATHTYRTVQAVARCQWRLGWPELKHGEPIMVEIARRDDSGPADVFVGPEGVTFETLGCRAWQPR